MREGGGGVRAGIFGELPAGCITIRTIPELYKRACNRVQLREAREEKKNDKRRKTRRCLQAVGSENGGGKESKKVHFPLFIKTISFEEAQKWPMFKYVVVNSYLLCSYLYCFPDSSL